MVDIADRPRLRALEAFPVEQDGERLIGLRDPSGFSTAPRRLSGLIAPHIDFHRGGPTYAWAYRARLERVVRENRKMLESVTASDPGAFFASVAADGDSRRICGLSPIYAFLRALPWARGELLRYGQWPDQQGTVSFCAAAFS